MDALTAQCGTAAMKLKTRRAKSVPASRAVLLDAALYVRLKAFSFTVRYELQKLVDAGGPCWSYESRAGL
eukprot:987316-Prymnesium_polylepis.1